MKGNMLLDAQKVEFNKAKLKKGGENFEIVIEVDPAIRYKEGQDVDIKDILRSEHIWADANKGEQASEIHMKTIFGTNDVLQIAKVILDEGEIQITSEIRDKERERKKQRIIGIISREAIDPKTKLPHPPERVKLAMQEAKIKIDEFKTAEQQLDHIVRQLRTVLPISFEKKQLAVRVPAQFAGKVQGIVRRLSEVTAEDWLNDGSWSAELTVSPGALEELTSELNNITKGSVDIKER
ncbi:ribosome assembly factor SBDS [Candidatus Woesearchaeota archaeon]|nr:ribosome assembly factor SBDS [Candidatus Woesearchaeota archaeon]